MFSKAIVKFPSSNFAHGLTSVQQGFPDLKKTLEQHQFYCQALERCGLQLTYLPADDNYPDSTFVEDTAIFTEKGVILALPGDISREGEVQEMKKTIQTFTPSFASIEKPGSLDGGDICEAEQHFFIGLSKRTNEEGSRQLSKWLVSKGYTASVIDIRSMQNILHLKSGIAYIGENRMVVIPSLAGHPDLKNYELILTDQDEDYAANCVRVNQYLFMAKGFPKLSQRLKNLGYSLIELDMSEFQKMDGGLSCLSLRF